MKAMLCVYGPGTLLQLEKSVVGSAMNFTIEGVNWPMDAEFARQLAGLLLQGADIAERQAKAEKP